MTRRETEWTESQRDLLRALLEVEAGECGRCGEPLAESTDPANEDGYDVPPATRCHACTALGHAADAYTARDDEGGSTEQPQALRFSVRLRDTR